MSRSPRAAVIGAGPAGLAAAYELAKSGVRVDVYERAPHIGGMARSVELWGEQVDLGPHVLVGGDPQAESLWLEIAGSLQELPVRRAILRGGRFVEYPPTPGAVARGMRLRELVTCTAGFVVARLSSKGVVADNAKAWFVARYGEGLYNCLVQSYIEKLWGCDGTLIDVSYVNTVAQVAGQARQRVASPTLRYPKQGLSAAWDRLAGRIGTGGVIHLGATVEALLLEGGRVVGLRVNGHEEAYDFVLSSAPLRSLLGMLPEVPGRITDAAARLRTRNIVLVHLRAHAESALRHAWVFVDDPALAVGRVSDSRFWQDTAGRSDAIITMEYWCEDSAALWTRNDDEIGAAAAEELTKTGLLPGVRVSDSSVTRLRGALPVPSVGFQRHTDQVTGFITSIRGLETIGRHGTFTLDSTIGSLADGLAAARRAVDFSRVLEPRQSLSGTSRR